MKKSTFQTESRTTVVPIINVSLVVVLTLMMISPFLAAQETDVDLPVAKSSEVDDTDNIEITFNLDREIWVGEDQLLLEDVPHYLGLMFADSPHAVAVVKADRNLPYGEVEMLIAAVEASDVTRIALATREKDEWGLLMMMQHIDRSRSIRGSMTFSFALHGGLLLLLALMVGRQAALINEGGELTEIAYIEAKYGEDVAAKVKLKEKPRLRPEPPGRGVNTDSAMEAPLEASPEAPRPQPKAKPRMTAPERSQTVQRPAAAQVDVKTPTAVTAAPPKTLATAPQLAAKAPQPKSRQVLDSSRLPGSLQKLEAKDASAPAAKAAGRTTGIFAPQTQGLQSRTGSVVAGQDVLADREGARGSASVAEAPAALAGGGGLKADSGAAYQAPSSSLAPAGGRSSGKSGKGVLDVDGPTGSGGGKKTGRKTILNYGSGGGGRGGSLNGRQRIAEPAVKQEIVAQSAPAESAPQSVADVKLDGNGVNMTISGQIQGRKILSSVPPAYSATARKKGWEGVVAVHFTVKADGRVKDNMYFDQTSVHRDLNQAAMAAIKQFVFAPLGADQAAVEQWGVITIVFRLK